MIKLGEIKITIEGHYMGKIVIDCTDNTNFDVELYDEPLKDEKGNILLVPVLRYPKATLSIEAKTIKFWPNHVGEKMKPKKGKKKNV